MCCCMIETSSVPPRKSSSTFGKFSENVRKRSSSLRNNFGKSSEIFGKSSKTSSLVCLYNKQNITCPLVDMNFIFSWSTRYLTRSLRSLVRYRIQHSKIKFISTRRHVISSIYWSCKFLFYLQRVVFWGISSNAGSTGIDTRILQEKYFPTRDNFCLFLLFPNCSFYLLQKRR